MWLGPRRTHSGRRSGLADVALDVADASQGAVWASLELRGSRCGLRWGRARAVLGVAGALAGSSLGVVWVSQGTLLTSLGPRRGRSGRRWGVGGDALGVAGAPQRPLWTSLENRRRRSGPRWAFAEAALGVAGAVGAVLGVAGASGLLDFNFTLYLTAMLVMGFSAFLHFNASSWSRCFPSLQDFFG